MSIDNDVAEQRTKGETIKEMVESTLSARGIDDFVVQIVKDSPGLTKVRLQRIIQVHAEAERGGSV